MERRAPVLVVEDNEDVRELLTHLLAMHGHRVETAANGSEALDALAHIAAPCVILLDLMMPVMSGWQLLDELKTRNLHQESEVIIVSAASEKSLPTGYAIMRKPVDYADLLDKVDRSTRGFDGHSAASHA